MINNFKPIATSVLLVGKNAEGWIIDEGIIKHTSGNIFLTKNGEGDLVVMDIAAYDQREKQLELREKLIEIEEARKAGAADIPARTASNNLRASLRGKEYV